MEIKESKNSLQEQLNKLYEGDKETLSYQEQILKNRHHMIPIHLIALSAKTGMSRERILNCAQMTATDDDPWYNVIERMATFYRHASLLEEGGTPQ